MLIDTAGDFELKDLTTAGETVVAAQGGYGGKGNTRFKSSINQAPRDFTRGGLGEKRRLTFELKVIADVGLLGKPNAGKSTLLSASLARGPRSPTTRSQPKSPTWASSKSTWIGRW